MLRGLNFNVGPADGVYFNYLPRGLTPRAGTPPRITPYGAFAHCNSSDNEDDGLAVKVVRGSSSPQRIDETFMANKVLKASEETPHPNLLARYPASDRFPAAPGTLVSITRWLNGGTLLSVLEKARSTRTDIPLQDVLRYTMDVVSGVAHLHTRLDHAHLDIRLRNIMLHSARSGDVSCAVVVDFGCSVAIGDDGIAPVTRRGKYLYMAPEVRVATSPVTINCTRADVCVYVHTHTHTHTQHRGNAVGAADWANTTKCLVPPQVRV